MPDTPSKRMRIMTSEMASTSSGSFLVSKNPYKSEIPLPQMLEKQALTLPAPDWSLLMRPPADRSREQLEAENQALIRSLANAKGYVAAFADREETLAAQAVVQDMALIKLNSALHSKEMKKAENDGSDVLNDGMGRLWSDARILEYQKRKRTEKVRKAAEKERRKELRSSKKALKTMIDAEWATIKEKHDENLQKWNKMCTELKEKGFKAKDLPKKPCHETKRSVIARLSGCDSEESEEDTDND
ncbi:hypothetical protein DFH05DRAFT_1391070 [Lentinula detonsa]|uniref:Uncharacterized protein n=1 Tax=Lentinula detonsa TaxID=2804962 RepID=A0A9W8U170_9AGAR|nr:hypothetical protein DFH05DRAFT_1391070 [Lentinula detonsa]